MLRGMTLKSLFQWQVYFRQQNERADAEIAKAGREEVTAPGAVMNILDRYKGTVSG